MGTTKPLIGPWNLKPKQLTADDVVVLVEVDDEVRVDVDEDVDVDVDVLLLVLPNMHAGVVVDLCSNAKLEHPATASHSTEHPAALFAAPVKLVSRFDGSML